MIKGMISDSHRILREPASLQLPASKFPLARHGGNSNRQTLSELETLVTYTKETPGLISNRQWYALFREISVNFRTLALALLACFRLVEILAARHDYSMDR